jgi:hypothetical protein
MGFSDYVRTLTEKDCLLTGIEANICTLMALMTILQEEDDFFLWAAVWLTFYFMSIQKYIIL